MKAKPAWPKCSRPRRAAGARRFWACSKSSAHSTAYCPSRWPATRSRSTSRSPTACSISRLARRDGPQARRARVPRQRRAHVARDLPRHVSDFGKWQAAKAVAIPKTSSRLAARPARNRCRLSRLAGYRPHSRRHLPDRPRRGGGVCAPGLDLSRRAIATSSLLAADLRVRSGVRA